MTDANLIPPSYPGFKGFLADLARPFAIYATSGSTAAAVVLLAQKVTGDNAAFFIGTVFAGLGALYGAKALELSAIAKQSASVQIAQAQGGGK